MRDVPDMVDAAADAVAPPDLADENWGWYLYGISREGRQGDVEGPGDTGPDGGQKPGGQNPAERICSAGLVAVVRRVPLAEFTPDALRGQAENPAWIETMARQHHAVIETVHRTCAILPAKFGSVYPRAEDVRTALAQERDDLLARLSWIEGCDEWGIRLYGELATMQQRADEEQEGVRRAREELASASPGRAYLLRRKLADQRDGALERFLDDLASQAYERFAAHARAGQVTRRVTDVRSDHGQQSPELLRAAFLVPRLAAEDFIEDVGRFSESQDGLWCEYSGPWPPYSFAEPVEDRQDE